MFFSVRHLVGASSELLAAFLEPPLPWRVGTAAAATGAP